MKPTDSKKLVIKKSTLRDLNEKDLKAVQGGFEKEVPSGRGCCGALM